MSGTGARLTLVIPALAGGARLSSLERMVARGRREPLADRSLEHAIASLFGLSPDAEWPLGALERLGEGAAADEAWWFRAAPAHFYAARDRLRVAAVEEIDEAEARTLIDLFNGHFGADGWRLESAAAARWYLRAPAPQAVRTRSLQEAMQNDLRAALPEGPDALRCHRFLNEVQMLFHAGAVNAERESRGRFAVNGIWLWGGGRTPRLPRRYDRAWSDRPLVRGLARAGGGEGRPLPPRLPTFAGASLALIEPDETAEAWRAAEAAWFAPAEQGLRSGALEEVVVQGDGFAVRVGRAELRRWWRVRRALGSGP